MYKVVDLFAGAGGLSLGFMQTKKYDIKVAFENNPNMQATYKKNHASVDVRGDVCSANYDEIREKYGKIDVVIGGPPCQGFSNANRQKNHAISQNNMLVKQYIRAIRELQQKLLLWKMSVCCAQMCIAFIWTKQIMNCSAEGNMIFTCRKQRLCFWMENTNLMARK